ncbi:MAG: DUF2784 domain-containing protein [Candidatus Edwardsbacteria bacterium]|nr:DUF2784 domain-containing protein [Candidatus Edwardsbacteria bacterium]MBU1575833.1 DUF2784 domain-containing protein [Candidatus Edwardsbacteria bacterium]MBU2463619.1 DUF2784 domain-containing protein [Candidatus Edwardsbacteria bacterium]MBU2593047.1 DUF2784 domain-containing protein [Candidatus Edwardsbacteria bacterium]
MAYLILADIVVLIHLLFIVFVILGGLLCFKWRKILWFHVPAFIWGAAIEFSGGICPLTPLENWLRYSGGREIYSSGFIEHYIIPVIYPDVLTRNMQIAFGILALTVNACIYAFILYYKIKRKKT